MYELRITRKAQKAISKFPLQQRDKIRNAIEKLAHNPRPRGSVKLTGRDGWRIRVGSYRVLYEINDKEAVVVVVKASLRGKAYQ